MPGLKTLQILQGPSPEGDEPTVAVLLSAEPAELAGVPAAAERLQAAFKEWFRPTAQPGTDLPSVGRFAVELALALLNEFGSTVKVATARPDQGGVRLVLGYLHPTASMRAIEAAVRLTFGAAKATDKELAHALRAFQQATALQTPDPQICLLLKHAREQGIPTRVLDWSSRLWLMGWGARSEIFFENSPGTDSLAASRMAKHKDLAKRMAVSAGFRTLPSILVTDPKSLEQVARAIGFPCVAKPRDRGQSRGVTVDIRSLAELNAAWKSARELTESGVLVERHAEGEVHRLMVVRGRFWKAVQRPRVHVFGDGKSTVHALLQALNAKIAGLIRTTEGLGMIPTDAKTALCLRRQGFEPTSVPAAGVRVVLREVPLLKEGACQYAELTDRVCPEIRLAAEQLARLLGVDSLGIDVLATDIGKAETCNFLEANLTPGSRLLLAAGVSGADITRTFLGDRPARLPLTLLVAPRAVHGRLRERLPRAPGLGWTDGRAVGLGERTFPTTVRTAGDGLDLLVRNRDLTALAILADPEDLAANGLPADRIGTTVILAGATPSAEWEAVLRRLSDKVVVAKDEAEAAAQCAAE